MVRALNHDFSLSTLFRERNRHRPYGLGSDVKRPKSQFLTTVKRKMAKSGEKWYKVARSGLKW